MNIEDIDKYSFFKNKTISKFDLLKNQGFSNINYKIQCDKRTYLCRVFKSDLSVNISREYEFKIQKKAHKLNIAPKPILLDLKNKLMITNFSKGEHKRTLKKKDLENLIITVKKVHTIKTKQKAYKLKKEFLNYDLELKDKESKNLIKSSLKELKKIQKYKKQLVLTHHDLNPKNILFLKNKIKIIDWEYAGVNDCFFDLATIACEFNLDKKEEDLLLKTYFKKVKIYHLKKLYSYKIIYNSLCLLWFKSLKQR